MYFCPLLTQEFKKTLKTASLFTQNILFFTISCTIFLIISQDQPSKTQTLLNITAFSLIFSLIFVNSNFLKQDFRDGTIEQLLPLLENFEIYILVKVIINWIIYALPVIVAATIITKLTNTKIDTTNTAILFTLASIPISFICAFCATLSLGSSKSPIIAIFALPLIIPTLLITLPATTQSEKFATSCQALIAIAILFGVISSFLSAKIVKIVTD